MLNIDGAPITSKSHTHPSHSQTSRLLNSSLSLGVPVSFHNKHFFSSVFWQSGTRGGFIGEFYRLFLPLIVLAWQLWPLVFALILLSINKQKGLFHFHRETFSPHLKMKVAITLSKTADLLVSLNLDGSPITSRTPTHPSHSETSRLLTSSLSLGVPVPQTTQCMWDVWTP
jgi:hypothetical protein